MRQKYYLALDAHYPPIRSMLPNGLRYLSEQTVFTPFVRTPLKVLVRDTLKSAYHA